MSGKVADRRRNVSGMALAAGTSILPRTLGFERKTPSPPLSLDEHGHRVAAAQTERRYTESTVAEFHGVQ